MLAVLTGGPGTGKSTLLEALGQRGYTTVPESSRLVQRLEKRKSERAEDYDPVLPESDPTRFNEVVLDTMQAMYRSRICPDGAATVADRHFLDIIGYTALYEVETPPGTTDMVRRYKPDVAFFLDFVPSYENDGVRHESRAEAERIDDVLRATYDYYNIDTVDLPVPPGRVETSVQRRADQVISYLEGAGSHIRGYGAVS